MSNEKAREFWQRNYGKFKTIPESMQAYSNKENTHLNQKIRDLESRIHDALEVADHAPELNMGNYSDDQVHDLNNAMIQVVQILTNNQ